MLGGGGGGGGGGVLRLRPFQYKRYENKCKTSRRNERREKVLYHICLLPFVLKLNKNGVFPQFFISALFFFNKFPHVFHVTIQTSQCASVCSVDYYALLFCRKWLRLRLALWIPFTNLKSVLDSTSTSTNLSKYGCRLFFLFYCVLVSIIRIPGSRLDGNFSTFCQSFKVKLYIF